MSSNLGFYISKLHIIGTNKKVAKLEFFKGANMISGLSDTGKSYIFGCLNFMLGGGDVPKNIPEVKGYEDLYLEIKTFSGKVFTLKRKLKGGNFTFKEVELEHYSNNGIEKKLLAKHSNTNVDNISTFLLKLCGFKEVFVRKDQRNSKRELSFRDIAKFTLIDEERIITEKSPIYFGSSCGKSLKIILLLLSGIIAITFSANSLIVNSMGLPILTGPTKPFSFSIILVIPEMRSSTY
jgi:hypothetical protein